MHHCLYASYSFLLLIWIISASIMLKVFCASPKKPCWFCMSIVYCVFKDKCRQSAKRICGIGLFHMYGSRNYLYLKPWNADKTSTPLMRGKSSLMPQFICHIAVCLSSWSRTKIVFPDTWDGVNAHHQAMSTP